MMPVSQLLAVARTLDGERGSPVADAAAAAWGHRPGLARFWRSSASHVFTVPGTDGAGRAYLRFVPAWWRRPEQVAAVVGLLSRLAGAGAAVVRPVPSAAGRLAETVDTPLGPVHAMVLAAAPGECVEVEELTADRALSWGAALARLHRDCADHGADAPLPEAFAELDRAADLLGADPTLVHAIDTLTARLRALPRDPASYGLVHGDFELDNLAWVGASSTAYDFDEAARSWFAADIAFAVRDLADGSPLLAQFLAGYRDVRPLTGTELGRLPLFAAAHAASWLVRVPAVLDTAAGPGDPAWLTRLRTTLAEHSGRQRDLLLAG
jgi:Ser/Thr protein kinase RdoA (MazF antagonist)